MGTIVKIQKEVYLSDYITTDVEIEKEDVIRFLKKCTPEELQDIQKGLGQRKNSLKYKPASIMEQLAFKELKEVLHWKGAEHIMNILKGATP